MSGADRLFFDTNAAIALLNGDGALHARWQQARWAGVSVITVLEFQGWPQLDERMRRIFLDFVERVHVIDLRAADHALLHDIAELRRARVLKLPDAIVLGSARHAGAMLATRDARLQSVAAEVGVEVCGE